MRYKGHEYIYRSIMLGLKKLNSSFDPSLTFGGLEKNVTVKILPGATVYYEFKRAIDPKVSEEVYKTILTITNKLKIDLANETY